MNNSKFIERLMARKMALENAAEFIRGHGEEGGIYQEDFEFDIELYLKECKKISKALMNKAKKIQP